MTFILIAFGAAAFLISMAVAYLTGYVAEDLRPRDHEDEPPARKPNTWQKYYDVETTHCGHIYIHPS